MAYRKTQAEATSAPDLFSEGEGESRAEKRLAAERRSHDLARIARKMITDGYNREHPAHKGKAPDGVCHCGSPLFTDTNGIYKNDSGDYYYDHMTCDSWACPVCAPKRDYLRQKEIEQALLAAHSMGHKMVFLTFTMPHWSKDSCTSTRQAIQDAYTKMSRRSRLRRCLDELGFVHQVRCWDFTFGDNGWHPHIHSIWFLNSPLDPLDISVKLQKVVGEQWASQVMTCANRKVSRRHGFLCEPVYMDGDEERTASDLAAYTAKRISQYATDPDKSGEAGSTPFSFLVPPDDPRYPEYSRIFYDFYKGQKGVRRCRFSPGFREFYGIEEATFERPAQNKIAATYQHHINFLADISNFHAFKAVGAAHGDREALKWLDERAGEYWKGILAASTDEASRFYLGDIEAHPEKWSLIPRDYVIDFLSGADERAAGLNDYADRARYLAYNEHARIEAMYEALERRRADDMALTESHRRYRERLDALEVYNLMLPADAPPMSGLGLALLGASAWEGCLSALLTAPDDGAEDYWF